jgi:hypothetical protein
MPHVNSLKPAIPVVVIVLLVAALARPAAAQGLQDFFDVPHSSTHIGKLKTDNGSITCTQIDSKSTGSCSSAQPPDGNCGHIDYSCTVTGGTAGAGTALMTFEVDLNAGLTSRGSGNPTSLAPDCYPFVGDFTATGKKDAFQEETGIAGIACDPLSGENAALIGGWQLLDWANFDPCCSDGAGGSLTGTIDTTTGALKLVLRGKAF